MNSDQPTNNLTDNDYLQLDKQICFPLYSASNAVIRAYRPYLDALDLTYLQYMVLMVLWQEKQLNVKALGEKLYLDSGTLTPLLKRLEAKGFVSRKRSELDERARVISLTSEGERLKSQAKDIPMAVAAQSGLTENEHQTLKKLCLKILATERAFD